MIFQQLYNDNILLRYLNYKGDVKKIFLFWYLLWYVIFGMEGHRQKVDL